MKISRNNIPAKNLSFEGLKKSNDKTGENTYKFYYLFDTKKYDCELELYQISKDSNLNYKVGEPIKINGEKSVKLDEKNGYSSQISEKEMNLYFTDGFAYRFKLTDKKSKNVSYGFDNGSLIGVFDKDPNKKYNLVLSNRATINKNGPMQLIMPDGYNPSDVNSALRAQALAKAPNSENVSKTPVITRTHANKLGGNFYGIIEKLDDIADEGIVRIVGTPFTQDKISSHKYWTENAFRIAPDFGKETGYKHLQEELFKKGINWVSDAALVNEGVGGIHISEYMRKGEQSFSKDMFRISGRPSLGLLPNESKDVRAKLVNAPFIVNEENKVVKNSNYNSHKPTYVQLYDERLTSEEDKKSDKTFSTYANKTTGNIFEITKHDDAVYPYSFEVDPAQLERNVKRLLADDNTARLDSVDNIKKVCDFDNFRVVTKSESSGIEVWDGNVDIPKLKFYLSDKDYSEGLADMPENVKKDAEKGTLAVRDYAINSGKYWTKLTSDIQLAYLSNYLAENKSDDYMATIEKGVKSKQIPALAKEVVDNEVISNVLNGDYKSKILDDYTTDDYSEYITKNAMDVPLETIPVANNLLGVLTSPYISKKANTDDELGVSRFELYQDNNPNLPEKYSDVYSKVDDFYVETLTPVVQKVLGKVDNLSDEDGEITEYGRYVVSEIAPDLTKYLLLKALNPSADVTIDEKGNFDFSNVKEDEITIQSLGISYSGKSLEEEASIVVNTLEKRIENIPSEQIADLSSKVAKRFENRTLEDFKVAEMILDRTESGLGWRIDATKDIASIDSVRAGVDNMQDTWDNVIDFWKRYNETVLSENPHAYTTAEITDLWRLFDYDKEGTSKYKSDSDAEKKFIEQTGITSVANYNYFFSRLPALYSPLQDSWQVRECKNVKLRNDMDSGWTYGEDAAALPNNPGFLFQTPEDGVKNSYNFVGNHDKPRILHLLALDKALFESHFDTEEHQAVAKKVLGKNKINFEKVSAPAIAMGDRLLTAFEQTGESSKEVKDAISKLAQGKKTNPNNPSEDIAFDATAFGTKSFELVISEVLDEAALHGAKFDNRAKTEANVLKSVLEPAFDRYKSIYKLLTVLPGSPTDFAGDKVGATGFETPAKNYHQQNRNPINWQWLSDDNYKFIQDNNKELLDISKMRNDSKLSALNDGDTVVLNLNNEHVHSFIRYNDESSVLVFTSNAGAQADGQALSVDKKLDRPKKFEVDLSTIFAADEPNPSEYYYKRAHRRGLKHGITEGTVFKNVRSEDKANYVVSKGKDGNLTLVKSDGSPLTIEPEDLNTLVLYQVK